MLYMGKPKVVFFHFSFHATLFFPLMNALVYVDVDQVIIREKIKQHEMKNRKSNFGSWYIKNMEYFQAFLQSIKLSINPLFLKGAAFFHFLISRFRKLQSCCNMTPCMVLDFFVPVLRNMISSMTIRPKRTFCRSGQIILPDVSILS